MWDLWTLCGSGEKLPGKSPGSETTIWSVDWLAFREAREANHPAFKTGALRAHRAMRLIRGTLNG